MPTEVSTRVGRSVGTPTQEIPFKRTYLPKVRQASNSRPHPLNDLKSGVGSGIGRLLWEFSFELRAMGLGGGENGGSLTKAKSGAQGAKKGRGRGMKWSRQSQGDLGKTKLLKKKHGGIADNRHYRE